MNIVVTGATGTIGRHLVANLLEKGHRVTAVARCTEGAEMLPRHDQLTFLASDIHALRDGELSALATADIVFHLAWSGLSDYRSLVHIEETLQADYRFLKGLVVAGLKRLVVTGTCFEYGMQSGCLTEDLATYPVTPYALAKDTLRKFLQALQQTHPFSLQWARIFYLYGEGQKPGSLLGQLDAAIRRGEAAFNMSGGEQLRDYLPVKIVAERIGKLMETPAPEGIVNICSGKPVSVRRLVEEYIAAQDASIALNLGFYPYPAHEPMAFWGSTQKWSSFYE